MMAKITCRLIFTSKTKPIHCIDRIDMQSGIDDKIEPICVQTVILFVESSQRGQQMNLSEKQILYTLSIGLSKYTRSATS